MGDGTGIEGTGIDGRGADPAGEVTIRPAVVADRPAMIELCRTSLGWAPDDPNERFFSWKHDDNPFGASPAWVAEVAGVGLVGVRVFMRWRFRDGDRVLSAVRAVDTATHPDMQGRGIFRTLTLGALPDLASDGVEAVFNTPNDQSRPGYLKMGWHLVGRVPVAVRVRSLGSAVRMRGARAAASKWSRRTDVGLPAATYLADTDAVGELLSLEAPGAGVRTDRSAEFLRWRYSFDELDYRVIPLGDRMRDGLVVFRLRERGTALEAAVCDVIDPAGRGSRAAIGWMLRHTGADYAIRCQGPGAAAGGFVPVPSLGPLLTWRPLGSRAVPAPSELTLALGDVELF